MASTLTHLQCSRTACGNVLSHSSLQNLCPVCKSPLLARYDLAVARQTLSFEALRSRVRTLWRYEEVLPGAPPVTLGEGMTPLIHAQRLGERTGLRRLYIKDEGLNPTASFKARGLSAAVTMAKALGATTVALPTAGNAGGRPRPHTRRRRPCTASSPCRRTHRAQTSSNRAPSAPTCG